MFPKLSVKISNPLKKWRHIYLYSKLSFPVSDVDVFGTLSFISTRINEKVSILVPLVGEYIVNITQNKCYFFWTRGNTDSLYNNTCHEPSIYVQSSIIPHDI